MLFFYINIKKSTYLRSPNANFYQKLSTKKNLLFYSTGDSKRVIVPCSESTVALHPNGIVICSGV